MDKAKLWKRANQIGNAELLEFQRYIENRSLREDVRKIQIELSLPLSLNNDTFWEDPIYLDWMGWDEPRETIQKQKTKRRRKLVREVRKILDKYKIPLHFFGSLHSFIVYDNRVHTYQTKGFPQYIHGPHKFGDYGFDEWQPLCVITVETDLANPLVLENIKAWQRRYKQIPPHRPPLPIQIGRKKDYRPVWEWQKRNPDITDKEIAKMLGKNRVTVVRALKRLDKENSLQK